MKPNLQRTRKSQFALCSALLTGLGAGPALLQAQEQLMLEEVVVTATKRETNLMETSAAVSAFDSSTMDKLGIDNELDLVVHTPSLTIAPSRVSIRGVGRANIALGSDPGVGIYWDGVYNTETGIFGYSNFLDIDRIEVLRGPQGSLYGRNSIGGAVNFVSKQPDDEEWNGQIRAELGNHDQRVLQGLASGPVTDKLSVLLAASKIERDGFQKNINNGKRYDENESSYGTISLKHLTTDRWTNSLKLIRREADLHWENPYSLDNFSTDYIQQMGTLNFPGMFPGQNFANLNQGMTRQNPALNDVDDVAIDFDPVEKSERSAVFFISEYDADSFSVKYTAGYSEFDFSRNHDADGTTVADQGLDWSQLSFSGLPVSLFVPGLADNPVTPSFLTRPFAQEASFISHELQITSQLDGPFTFIGGLYYYQSDEEQRLSFVERNDDLMAVYRFFGGFINGPVSNENFLFKGEADLETTSYAAYGQIQWDISDSTMLTFGLRFSRDEKEGGDNTFVQYVREVGSVVDPANPTDPGNATIFRQDKDSWTQPTWRLGVDHTLSDNHFLYASLATGYRSGGFNFMAPTDNAAVDSVDPEELLSFEVGYKGSLLDQRVNLSTAVYVYDYEDLQVRKSEVVNGVTVPIYENAASARAWGIEAELMALLTANLTLSGTWSYNNTEYDDFQSVDSNACALGPLAEGLPLDPLCTEEIDLNGNSFPLSPEHKASLDLSYYWKMFNLEWSATTSYSYTDEQFISSFNNGLYDVLDDHDRLDARLNVAPDDLAWEITAFVKNIGDDREVIFRERPDTTNHQAPSTLSDPRLYGLRLSYYF